MSEIKIYLELDDDIQQFVESNVNIADVLQTENIDAEVTYGVGNYLSEEGARTKDVVTIILASSALLVSIAFAISQLLNTYYNKPILIEFYEIHELKDSNGNLLRDEDGKPQLIKVKKYQLIEPREQSAIQNLEFQFSLRDGIVIKFNSKVTDKETDPN